MKSLSIRAWFISAVWILVSDSEVAFRIRASNSLPAAKDQTTLLDGNIHLATWPRMADFTELNVGELYVFYFFVVKDSYCRVC